MYGRVRTDVESQGKRGEKKLEVGREPCIVLWKVRAPLNAE